MMLGYPRCIIIIIIIIIIISSTFLTPQHCKWVPNSTGLLDQTLLIH